MAAAFFHRDPRKPRSGAGAAVGSVLRAPAEDGRAEGPARRAREGAPPRPARARAAPVHSLDPGLRASGSDRVLRLSSDSGPEEERCRF